MSRKKRRINRKISMLARMDLQMRSYWMDMHMEKKDRMIAAMKALGARITRTGRKERAWQLIAGQRAAIPHPAKGIRGSCAALAQAKKKGSNNG